MNASAYWFGYVLGSLAVCIILGFVTKHINESKGYSGGFAWGFWLNLIGVIVVACKPDNRNNVPSYNSSFYPISSTSSLQDQQILYQGGWKCSNCGKVNQSFIVHCICGRTKNDTLNAASISSTDEKEEKTQSNKPSTIVSEAEQIRQFKALLDEGIITCEEFEEKKKKILGI